MPNSWEKTYAVIGKLHSDLQEGIGTGFTPLDTALAKRVVHQQMQVHVVEELVRLSEARLYDVFKLMRGNKINGDKSNARLLVLLSLCDMIKRQMSFVKNVNFTYFTLPLSFQCFNIS